MVWVPDSRFLPQKHTCMSAILFQDPWLEYVDMDRIVYEVAQLSCEWDNQFKDDENKSRSQHLLQPSVSGKGPLDIDRIMWAVSHKKYPSRSCDVIEKWLHIFAKKKQHVFAWKFFSGLKILWHHKNARGTV